MLDIAETSQDPTPPPAARRRPVVLIVDGEPDILASLEALLSYGLPDVKFVTAESGAKGMVIARANVLDMVLSGLRMSKMDGIEFLRQARVIQADIPMVIMTAGDESEFAKRAVEVAGLQLVVRKPFNVEGLVGLIGSLLQGPGAGAAAAGSSFREDGTDHASRSWDPPAPPVAT